MTAPAAPRLGRRVSFGAVVVLVGFLLLAPPMYLLGPFALLTVLSRPRTFRELIWLVASSLGVAVTLGGGVPLGPQLLRAGGLVLSVVFALLAFRSNGPIFSRAFLAVLLSALAIGVWTTSLGITWADVEQAFTAMLRASYEAMVEVGRSDPKSRQDLQAFFQPFLDAAPRVARVMPGLLALEGLAGAALAWTWHHRIAESPLGQPPARFREFRFNDHLVWGAIFTLGLLLMPLPPSAAAAALNLLVVWVGLYAVRGLAVATAFLAPAPPSLEVFTAGLAIVLAPVALGAGVAVGLADTWLDLRRRLPPSIAEGA
jgi:Predicted membrane protein (DUF2232)